MEGVAVIKVAIVGASGFIGHAVAAAVGDSAQTGVQVPAPRFTTAARGEAALHRALSDIEEDVVHALAQVLEGSDIVINCAGTAAPGATMTDELIGANALLPGVLIRAAARAGAQRVVHISSAAVHGHATVLRAADEPQPASPYGWSKRWGELTALAAAREEGVEVVLYRPTSVHGDGRAVTERIRRIARSPLSSVAGRGERPTPQVEVMSVGELALTLATQDDVPTLPVLHPWEGWTTASFLEHLGDGRRPRRIPVPIARSLLATARTAGRVSPWAGAQARRLEMLWFGQRQE